MTKKVSHTYSPPSEAEFELICRTILHSEMYPLNNRGLFLRWRDVTILKILFYAGLRPAECLTLRWKDIDFEHSRINVQPYFNKTKQDTPAVLTKPAKEALLDWHSVMQDLGMMFEFLFPSCETFEPLTSDRFCRIFRRYCKEAGLLRVAWITETGQRKYNLTPYSGRRFFGHEVAKKCNWSQLATKFMMRHKNLSSAEPYVQPTTEDLQTISKRVFG